MNETTQPTDPAGATQANDSAPPADAKKQDHLLAWTPAIDIYAVDDVFTPSELYPKGDCEEQAQ